ncbi:hypothetical protein ZWY2020_013733 [Hordeum vulgare]|nr:hypothetical protein ZWY2020_013733 [Hordeum vulgare]
MDDTTPFVLAQVIRGYALNRIWISGFLLDMTGAALMLTALSSLSCSPSQGLEFKNLSYTIVKKPEEAQGSIGWARAAEPTGCGASLSPSMTRFGIAAHFNATSSAVSEAAAVASSGAVHAVRRTEPVVSAEWLHANLRDPDVKVYIALAVVLRLPFEI